MPTKYHIHLTPSEREELEALIHRGISSARVQTRARILLLCDRSQPQPHATPAIAAALQCSLPTITQVRRRYVAGGLAAALYEKPRPGAKPKITGEVEATLTLLACSAPPAGKARWTLQMLADKLVELQLVERLSDVAVLKRLKKTHSSLGA